MTCLICDGNGLTYGDGSIVICPGRDCTAGQRIAKVLIAIGRGEPVALLDTLSSGFEVWTVPSGIIAPVEAKRKAKP